MSALNHIVRRSFSSKAVGPNLENIRKWSNIISSGAKSVEAKNACSQLSTLVSYYNKPSTVEAIPEIDWEDWKANIVTEGLVEKLQKNYESLQSQNYQVENVAAEASKNKSIERENLDYELSFQAAVWGTNYYDYRRVLLESEELGNLWDYSYPELFDIFKVGEVDSEALVETHNYLYGSKDDTNAFMYFTNQFNWGKKVVSFYRHPADDFKCIRATKNIMGR